MTTWVADGRYALRALKRQPSFTLIALLTLTLTLGIGTNTAISSVIKAVLLNPLPYEDPERVLVLWEVNVEGNSLRLIAGGVGIGLVAASLLARSMVGVLYGVSAFDFTAFALAALVLVVVGVSASLIPARRAVRIDPMTALREQ